MTEFKQAPRAQGRVAGVKVTILAVASALSLGSCDRPEAKPDPVGRYQIVNGTGANLFIVDTRDGKLWRCTYSTPDSQTHCQRVMDLTP